MCFSGITADLFLPGGGGSLILGVSGGHNAVVRVEGTSVVSLARWNEVGTQSSLRRLTFALALGAEDYT